MLQMLSAQTDLWRISRIIALINNIVCYFWLFTIICLIIISILCAGCKFHNSCRGHCEGDLLQERLLTMNSLYNLITEVIWCIMVVLMIDNNHKLFSTERAGANVIFNWLQIHGIFLVVIIFTNILPGLFGLFGQSVLTYMNGIILFAIIAVEMFIVYQFYKEQS